MASSQKPRDLSPFRRYFTRDNWFLAAAVLIGIAAAVPLFSQPGLLNTRGGGDSPFLLQRLQQLMVALAGGHFPVRWMPDANFGYGYPFYNYYAPLSIYIAGFFRLLGLAFVPAIKAAQLSGFIIASVAIYRLGRRWFGDHWAGLLAAAAYTLAPFHMVNVYVRGDSLAEFWAMALYPAIILGADHAFTKAKAAVTSEKPIGVTGRLGANWVSQRTVALLALAVAFLVLSHNISALIFAPFILLFLALQIVKDPNQPGEISANYWRSLSRPMAALLLSLGLSAWFWLPALGERGLAQMGPITSGYFHFSNHFRSSDLVQWGAIFNYDVAGGQAFRMSLLQAVVALVGLILLLTWTVKSNRPNAAGSAHSRPRLGHSLFIITGLIGATIMITPLSRFLWESLPLLPFVQFPWRFLSIQAFFAALATAGLAYLPKRQWIIPIIILLLMGSGFLGLKLDFLMLADEDVSAQRLAQYEWFTGNIGTTVSAEYLPASVNPRPYTSNWLNSGQRDAYQTLGGELSNIELVERKPTRQRWQVSPESPVAEMTVPTIDWPDWSAWSDAGSVEATAAESSGLLDLVVSKEASEVHLQLKRTPLRVVGELMTLGTFLIIGVLLRPRWPTNAQWQIAGGIVLALLFLFLLFRLWPARDYGVGDLTWDFDQMAYLHHATDGVAFDNGAVMNSYQYSHEEVAVGEELTIIVDWDEPAPEAVTLALASPAINRFSFAPILTSQSTPIIGSKATLRVDIPVNSPAGLYVPRITLDDARALTPSGQPRGDLFLRPFRIFDRPEPAELQDRDLDVRAEQILLRDAVLEVHLKWVSQAALANNYNFSLRLVNQAGHEVAQFDNQPGFGYLPSSLWSPGQWIDDWLAMPLTEEVLNDEDSSPLALVIRLYEVSSGKVALTKRLGQISWQQGSILLGPLGEMSTLPVDVTPVRVDFGDASPAIGLRGFDFRQEEEAIDLTLYWQSLAPDLPDYTHFVHLIDPESGEIVSQHDTMPQNDNYPTSQWREGEYVADPAYIDLTDVPTGDYELVIGLYQNLGDSFPRLPLLDGDVELVGDDSLRLPVTIRHQGQ